MDLQESIDRFSAPLTGLFMAWGAAAGDAVELAQESLADAHLGRATCRGDVHNPVAFGRWLRGIAKNKFRYWSRSRARRDRLVATLPPQSFEQYPAASNSAEQEATNERLSRLRSEIDRLPSKHREVILMHYLDETPVADVAALLSLSVKAVEGRLYQARKSLRRKMDPSTSWTNVTKAVWL